MKKVLTLALLVHGDEILLAMKKRGFGKGLWNGAGGKAEPGETIEQAMIRECQEEIAVTPLAYEKVVIHDFIFADGSSHEVHTFLIHGWEGEPTETEEMSPKWFKQAEIPYEKMWQDDIIWLPLVLQDKKLTTKFTFDTKDQVKTAALTVVDKLE